jgi:hypothetical protein
MQAAACDTVSNILEKNPLDMSVIAGGAIANKSLDSYEQHVVSAKTS